MLVQNRRSIRESLPKKQILLRLELSGSIMNNLNISAVPINGQLEIDLGTPLNGYIGLVDIALPRLDVNQSLVFISCDQVDSTCFNRKRVLKILYNDNTDGYQYHQFQNIMFYKLDSSDCRLTVRLYDDRGPIKLRTNEPVVITIQLKPETPQRWINM